MGLDIRVYLKKHGGSDGEWFRCPIDFEMVKQRFHTLIVYSYESEAPFSLQTCYMADEINEIFRRAVRVNEEVLEIADQLIAYGLFQNLHDFLNNWDSLNIYPDVTDFESLGQLALADKYNEIDPETDFKVIGQDYYTRSEGIFTRLGWVERMGINVSSR